MCGRPCLAGDRPVHVAEAVAGNIVADPAELDPFARRLRRVLADAAPQLGGDQPGLAGGECGKISSVARLHLQVCLPDTRTCTGCVPVLACGGPRRRAAVPIAPERDRSMHRGRPGHQPPTVPASSRPNVISSRICGDARVMVNSMSSPSKQRTADAAASTSTAGGPGASGCDGKRGQRGHRQQQQAGRPVTAAASSPSSATVASWRSRGAARQVSAWRLVGPGHGQRRENLADHILAGHPPHPHLRPQHQPVARAGTATAFTSSGVT